MLAKTMIALGFIGTMAAATATPSLGSGRVLSRTGLRCRCRSPSLP